MKELRELIQSRLNRIPNITFDNLISDDELEAGITYFRHGLQVDYDNWDLNTHGDFDKNYIMKVTLFGALLRKSSTDENTLEILDNALAEIKRELKDLNFKYSYRDLEFENNTRKIQIFAVVKYNEANNKFIV